MSDAEARQQPADQIARGIVGLDEAQHVIALPRQRQQRLGDAPTPEARDQAVLAALQFRQQQLELAVVGLEARV